MSFVQFEFYYLMIAMLLLYWMVRDVRWQNTLIVISSAIFYGWLVPWWLLLLYVSSLTDFVMGQLMVRAPAYRKAWLVFSLVTNLSLLFYFKYFDWFIANIVFAAHLMGLKANIHTLGIIMPAGISFYTFQTISYTVDVYRGEIRPRTRIIDYVAYVTFFPQLVAGPIERATNLLPQLERYRPFLLSNLRIGFGLAIYGAFKKIVIADNIAPYVDKVFVLDDPGGPLVYAATAGFMVQIYADFSGYTDMARGTAKMLGVDLVKNFEEPYAAKTTPEFWQRWHMSLSTWIRDYLMTPLLGDVSQITWWRFSGTVMLTMFVMGVWHGASWNFIVLGLFFGVCIVGYSGLQRVMPKWASDIPMGGFAAQLFHGFFILGMAGLLFREHEVGRILHFLGHNPFVAKSEQWQAAITVLTMTFALGVSTFTIEHFARRTVMKWLKDSPWYLVLESSVWSFYLVLIIFAYRSSVSDFVYFQF